MSFINEIAARLVAQNVGVIGSTIFMGSRATLPSGPGPILTIVETGGTGPTRIQNQDAAATHRPTASIIARANDYQIARTMAQNAYNALDGVFNKVLSGTFYLRMVARQEPTDIGLEEGSQRVMVAFNIEAETYPT